MEILQVPQGDFSLSRYPIRKNEKLRAWDAADEYLLNYFYDEYGEPVKQEKVLIVNDSFGALAAGLSKCYLTLWNDSLLAQQGLAKNFIENKLSTEGLKIKNSMDVPEGKYDFVIIKIPKSLALLE